MSNSDSEDSTAKSGPKDLFKCCHCDKAFASGQALRGLQNAHRVVRNVIEAHTNNFEHTAEAGLSAAAAAVAGEVRPEVNAGGAYYHQILYPTAGLMAVACGDYFDAQPSGMIRAEDHEPNKAPEGIVNVTRDFLGEWKHNSTNSVGYGAAAVSERSERTLTDPIFMVGHGGFAPEGARDDGEVEEEVTSEKTEELSLELKLGF